MARAVVIGSGPNGLAGAVTLARGGLATTVLERNAWAGGACCTREITLPGYRHDVGATVFPMGAASPFFRSLPQPVPWVEPDACCAHPLDDGTAVMLEHGVEATADNLDASDRAAYRDLMEPISGEFPALAEDLLGPVMRVPRHPLLLARLGSRVALPASALARLRFGGVRARALLAGMAAHAVMPLDATASSAVALVLMAAGHGCGWPLAAGGSQTITETLIAHLEALGGRVETDREVTDLAELEGPDVTLADVTPRQLLRLAGGELSPAMRRQLERFEYGGGSFKIDYALSEPIPWKAKECLRSATVHVGGTLEDVEASEHAFTSDRPFLLLVQPTLFDPGRAPAGRHIAWAYCHVPQGSGVDRVQAIERQIERFAPGFRECVLARSVMAPAALERWNPNLIGGDLSGGKMTAGQMLFRPTGSLYRTSRKGLYLCGSSTPPGGGVHGMAGVHAARVALRELELAGRNEASRAGGL